MKKILLLTENFPPIEGGSGRWFWELYSRLPEANITILTHDIEGGSEFDKTHSMNVIRAPMHSSEWGIKSVIGLRFYWRMFNLVRKLVKQHDIEEIHCGRVIHEGVIAWLVKQFTGVSFICYVHGEDVETAATSREQSWLVRKACAASGMLVCNSHNSKNLTIDLGFSVEDKCVVLHPGVDTSRFIPAPPNPAFKERMGWGGKRVLLTVGRLQRRKGQDYFLKAMPKLTEAFPDLFYAVVGRGECEQELRQMVADYGLDNQVGIYTGLDDEALIQCYQQCDCFVLPNRTIGNDIEGFGMVLVEAQACGKPVIAGDSGGTAETMKQGETGYIIDCSSPEAIIEGVSELLEKDTLIRDKSAPLEHVRKNLTWEAHVSKAKQLFSL